MTEVSQAQLHREAVEIALWETPSPEPDAAAMAKLAQLDVGDNDQTVGNKAGGDGSVLPDLGPLKGFGTWESVASTILRKTETISGFNPGSATFDPVAWNNYLQKFATIPFFLTYVFDTRSASISALSLEKGVDVVSDLIGNIMTPNDLQGVKTSIQKMASLAVSNKGQLQKNSNQQVGVLSHYASQLYVGAIRTQVAMQLKQKKGYEQQQQSLDIYRGYGTLDFDKCIRSANTLLAWDGQDVDQWANGTASASLPPNQSPAWNQ